MGLTDLRVGNLRTGRLGYQAVRDRWEHGTPSEIHVPYQANTTSAFQSLNAAWLYLYKDKFPYTNDTRTEEHDFLKSKTSEEAFSSQNQAKLPIMPQLRGIGRQMLERQPDFRISEILKNTNFRNS